MNENEILENELDELDEEWEDDSDPDSVEGKISILAGEISGRKENEGAVYEALGAYFVIVNGEIIAIPDDASCSPRGGWFPTIVSGPDEDENAELERIMKNTHIKEYFFDKYLEEISDYDEESAIEFFTEESDESLAKFNAVCAEVEASEVFDGMEDFVECLGRYGLNKGELYYFWEDCWIELYDNIVDGGEDIFYFCRNSEEALLEVLENIDCYRVKA